MLWVRDKMVPLSRWYIQINFPVWNRFIIFFFQIWLKCISKFPYRNLLYHLNILLWEGIKRRAQDMTSLKMETFSLMHSSFSARRRLAAQFRFQQSCCQAPPCGETAESARVQATSCGRNCNAQGTVGSPGWVPCTKGQWYGDSPVYAYVSGQWPI